MSPHAIAKNIDRIKKLRQHESDAFFAKKEAARLAYKRDADRLSRETAEALRLSDHWAPPIKESLLAGLETR